MARAHNIYIVRNSGIILAAFTVKWELLRYLARQDCEYSIDRWKVVIVRDGTEEVSYGGENALSYLRSNK